jgi:hypothetical protein
VQRFNRNALVRAQLLAALAVGACRSQAPATVPAHAHWKKEPSTGAHAPLANWFSAPTYSPHSPYGRGIAWIYWSYPTATTRSARFYQLACIRVAYRRTAAAVLRPADLPKQTTPRRGALVAVTAIVRVNGRVRDSDPSGRAAGHSDRYKKNQQSLHRPLGISSAPIRIDGIPSRRNDSNSEVYSHKLAKRDVSAITLREG